MHEPMTTQLVADVLRDLLAAFPSRHASLNIAHTAEVYRNGLVGLSGESLRAAAKVSIQSDTYFPKIARLRELASEWTRRNRVMMPGSVAGGTWDVCGVCGAKAVLRSSMRQARDWTQAGALLWDGLDEHNKPIPRMEESPERWVMEHDARLHHVAVADLEAAG